MQPLEKPEAMTNSMDDAPDSVKDAVSQLSFAYQRSQDALVNNEDAALTEGIRRAEAILFAAGEPISAEQISQILPHGVEAGHVLMALRAIYAPRGVTLVEVAGKWRFQTAKDLAFLFVEERQVQKKLGQAALETMAIIAYGQPVTRAEVEAVRGVAVSKSTIDTLLETGWVKMAGQRKTPGLPMTYATTDLFLEHFGLESLDTLPGKADLEAEGLLTDAIPDGFQMPDEEALSEEGMMIEDGADAETAEDAFVTNFMDDAEGEQDTAEAVEAEADIHVDEDWLERADGLVTADAGEDQGEGVISAFAYAGSPEVEVGDPEAFAETEESAVPGEEADTSGISVFSYVRDAEVVEDADEANAANADDEASVEAAVIRLSKAPETRAPERPMWDWTDEE